jgi:hypothetical protein
MTGQSCIAFIKYFRYDISDHVFRTQSDVKKEPAAAHQSFSSESVPTLSRTIPILEFLIEKWSKMAEHPDFVEMKEPIQAGIENLHKWYWKVDKSDAAFIALGNVQSNAIYLIIKTWPFSAQSQRQERLLQESLGCSILRQCNGTTANRGKYLV